MVFFFFNDTATTEIYTLSLHDALPIYVVGGDRAVALGAQQVLEEDLQREGQAGDVVLRLQRVEAEDVERAVRSEEHTSELQSRQYLVCRLLLEKKKKTLIVTCILFIYT